MKTLNLNANFSSLNLTEEDKKRNPVEIVSQVIENVILGYASQVRGLDEKERRQYYKICDAFEKVKINKAETIELDDEYIGFIRKCFRESKLIPNPLLKQVEKLIEEIKDR
jgi:hypothetical protein